MQVLDARGGLGEGAPLAQIARGEGGLEAGEFLTDFRVGLGRPGGVRRALAVAVLRPACEGGRGAIGRVCAEADGDDVPGERPRPERGP